MKTTYDLKTLTLKFEHQLPESNNRRTLIQYRQTNMIPDYVIGKYIESQLTWILLISLLIVGLCRNIFN